MLIPIAYLVASRIYKGRPAEIPLAKIAHAAIFVLLISVLFTAMNITQRVEPVIGVHTNLLLALFCAEASIFYIVAAVLYGAGSNVYLATTMACGSVWQLLNFCSIPTEYYTVTFAALGVALLAAYRFGAWERFARPALVVAAFRCANTLMSVSCVAAALMALSRIAIDHTDWSLAILMSSFVALGLLAAAMVRHSGFRRWYFAVTIVEALITFIIIQRQSHLTAWQKSEIFSTAVGLVMLIIGYTLWYCEQDRQSDAADFCLIFGSLLAGLPLAIAAIVNRFGFEISLIDELGLATVSILMLISGFMCRIRATTLIGGSLLVIHLTMLLVFVGVRAQLAVGVYLSIGGAALFALGILLSIYRDRLLALPKQIKQHEGVFRVLAWR
jgi:hypothetical protein